MRDRALSPLAGLSPQLTPVSGDDMMAIVAAHEAHAAGRPTGARKFPRFIIARRSMLNRRVLPEIDFTGADLEDSTFIEADLTRALFCGAVLRRCDFSFAQLTRADLRGVVFEGACLNWARLDEADLRASILVYRGGFAEAGASPAEASLRGASLNGSRLDDIDGRGVDFSNASMKGADLRRANLNGARLSNCNFDGANFAGAKVAEADFRGAILTNVDLSGLNLPRAALATCVIDPSLEALARRPGLMRRVDDGEAWGMTAGRAGRVADLNGEDLRPLGPALRGRKLPALVGRNVCAVGLDFSRCLLVGANFEGADLRGANFMNADLRGASFLNANLAHANFHGADLSPLELLSGRLHPVNLEGAVLDGTGIVRVLEL